MALTKADLAAIGAIVVTIVDERLAAFAPGATPKATPKAKKQQPIIAQAKVATPEIVRLEGESLNDAKRRLGLGGVCDACGRRFASEAGLDWHLANFTHPAA